MSKAHITIHDMARELNISASTVSRALHNHPRISEGTRKAVHELARKHNYRPNVVASSLRQGRSKTVGVVVPRINRNFFSKVISGMEEVLAASGFHLMICQSQERLANEQQALTTLLNARVDAIIISISMESTTRDHLENLLEKGISLFFFDRAVDDIMSSAVVVDDRLGAYQAVSHMIARGYRRIMHVTGPSHINIYHNRKLGYLDAMKDAGIRVDPAWMLEKPLIIEGGEEAFQQCIDQTPDAFFCAGDYAALGVMKAAEKHGLEVPKDLGICGFGNEPFTEFLKPSMTTVDQDGEAMGRLVATIFLECEQMNFTQTACKYRVLEPRLITRDSTKGSVPGKQMKNTN